MDCTLHVELRQTNGFLAPCFGMDEGGCCAGARGIVPALALGADAGGASPGRPAPFPFPALGALAPENATASWTGSIRLAPPALPLAPPAPPRGENTAKFGIDWERKLGGGIAVDPKPAVDTLARGVGAIKAASGSSEKNKTCARRQCRAYMTHNVS